MALSIIDLMMQWEDIGVFEYVLPFLLIFAVVFGILTTTNIFGKNRGVSMVVALAIALLALRVGFVATFFTLLFGKFAVGLSILLIIVILAALFIPKEWVNGWFTGFGIFGVVIGLIVTISTFSDMDWFSVSFWQDWWGVIVGGVILIILIVAIFVSAGKPTEAKTISVPIGSLR